MKLTKGITRHLKATTCAKITGGDLLTTYTRTATTRILGGV